jgi:3-oxoacyl-[acyl-carrier-protein] synthase-3
MVQAQALISAGMCRKALIVQSAVFSRVMPYDLPLSVNFGDGATAAVLGSVSAGRGLLGWSWFNDGSYHRAVCTAPRGGGSWQEAKGGLITSSLDPEKARSAIFQFGDMAKEAVVQAALKSGVPPRAIRYFACHQPTAWFVELCRRAAGLEGAEALSTFTKTAGVGPCNVMLNLNAGVVEGAVRRDDLVAIYAMGSGFTWGATILRWGR